MSKAKQYIDYIIEKWTATLPELGRLHVGWENCYSISTFISNWRAYWRTKGYEIINISSWEWRKYISTYYAQPIWKNT